eukprot:m.32517 g.32517  ORF g.32517 m.32517 type:complete len:176 (+) comp8422_c0_seq1:164-691(+)
MLHVSDYYPTFANMVGVSTVNTGYFPVDGIDFWPYITGENSSKPRQELLIAGCEGGAEGCNGAFLYGDLKLILGAQNPAGWYKIPNKSIDVLQMESNIDNCSNTCVFNLTADPEERNNLAKTQPDLVTMLKSRFNAITNVMVPHDTPAPVCTKEALCDQMNKNKGYFGPWLPPPN